MDNDTKKYRLIKARDLQPYEEAASLHITPTHRRMKILLNIKQFYHTISYYLIIYNIILLGGGGIDYFYIRQIKT